MMIDWDLARQVGGVGFGVVFGVLIILTAVIWLFGVIASRISTGSSETVDKQKGA
ncbi:MAG: OadG family protein [Dehalococcoidales bacterium]|nr:OadG family protein [Dehalococcoidales bacterium]